MEMQKCIFAPWSHAWWLCLKAEYFFKRRPYVFLHFCKTDHTYFCIWYKGSMILHVYIWMLKWIECIIVVSATVFHGGQRFCFPFLKLATDSADSGMIYFQPPQPAIISYTEHYSQVFHLHTLEHIFRLGAWTPNPLESESALSLGVKSGLWVRELERRWEREGESEGDIKNEWEGRGRLRGKKDLKTLLSSRAMSKETPS